VQTIASLLASSLPDYLFAIEHTAFAVSDLVREAGLTCPVCGTGECARFHARRRRKRVLDLSTGDVFRDLPILRVRLCAGATVSLMPAELWRGRATVSSVLETVAHVFRDGVEAAHEWVGFAGTGEPPFSRRTLRRWRDAVRSRLIGSALGWLGPRLDIHGSDSEDAADQIRILLDRLTGAVLVTFRAVTGRGVLDKPARVEDRPPPRSAARRVAGRFPPDPPHDPPFSPRPRGSWWPRNRRGPPRPKARKGGSDP
jgi:hypothetical protein